MPRFDDSHPIVIFDGHCMLCSGFVRFALRQDRKQKLRFLAAQTLLGSALYAHFGLRTDEYDTYVLLEHQQARVKSDAALRIFGLVGFPWSMICVGRVLPRGIRDSLYDWVARNRIRWFGRRETCYAPTESDKGRFLA
jgi:predicted DCC family thiol-disulfide oxidoreductase YuxK